MHMPSNTINIPVQGFGMDMPTCKYGGTFCSGLTWTLEATVLSFILPLTDAYIPLLVVWLFLLKPL